MQNNFSRKLRELRTEKGLRQKELAKMVGLHYNHIGRYERGESQPTADALKRLAKAFGVSVDCMVGESPDSAMMAAPGDDLELTRKLREVQKLPERDRELIKEFLDAFLTKRKLQELMAG
jgi:transcriptional regulator with XRE-family HTH domain